MGFSATARRGVELVLVADHGLHNWARAVKATARQAQTTHAGARIAGDGEVVVEAVAVAVQADKSKRQVFHRLAERQCLCALELQLDDVGGAGAIGHQGAGIGRDRVAGRPIVGAATGLDAEDALRVGVGHRHRARGRGDGAGGRVGGSVPAGPVHPVIGGVGLDDGAQVARRAGAV